MAITKTYFATTSSAADVADSDYIVVQQGTGTDGALNEMKKATIKQVRDPLYDAIERASLAEVGGDAGEFISSISQSSGVVSASMTEFASSITNSTAPQAVAPRADAVVNYIKNEVNTGSILNKINEKIGELDVGLVGNEGGYIKFISEANGIVSPTTRNFDVMLNDESGDSNVPTSKAVKHYVDSNISNLTGSVGSEDELIQSISQVDGKITGTTILIDEDSLSSSASRIPNSKVVSDSIKSLTGTIGGDNLLVKSVVEAGGKISGTTIPITGVITNTAGAIPNSKAVYDLNQTSIYSALRTLDFPNPNNPNEYYGQDGYYIKKVKQADGQFAAETKKFDTYTRGTGTTGTGSWSTGPSDNNVPSSKAVKDYADWKADVINDRIDKIGHTSSGAAGSFIQKVSQTAGEIQETVVAFDNSTIASYANPESSSYSSRTDVAPTVKAVTDQVKRLDDRISVANAGVASLNYSMTVADGKYISGLTQATGKISASVSDLATAATTGVKKAITSEAVRTAINALTKGSIGSSGAYIKTVSQNTGVLSATTQAFDTYTAGGGWKNGSTTITPSNDNSPTSLAVDNLVKEAKRQILQETESMSYLGAVSNTTEMAAKASSPGKPHLYGKGDVFVAKADFNLSGSSLAAYQVLAGDLIIVNHDCDTIESTTLDYFDIIDSSDKSITFGSTSAANGNFLAFSGETGRVAVDSGWNPSVISTQVAIATAAAASAASSASFADAEVDPYRDAASTSASKAASSAGVAESKASAASTSASKAASSAGVAASRATDASTSASKAASSAGVAASRATDASTSASQAASRATDASTSASQASIRATNASTSASQAASRATAASTSASAASTSASQAASRATAASTSASQAASYATAASTSASQAASRATAASTSASQAASYAAAANLEGIKNAASTSASAASSSAKAAASSATLVNTILADAVRRTGATGASQTISTNVIIGTGAGVTLNTDGTANFKGNTTFAGQVNAQTFNSTSSRKFKENIKPSVISALDLIDKVDIVDFNYISDDEKTPHIGFIAEDTDPLLSTPHLNSMDYTNCIGTLLKAVQEITKGMDKLEKRLDAIK